MDDSVNQYYSGYVSNIINETVQTDEVSPEGMNSMGIIEQEIRQQVESAVSEEEPSEYADHLYPVVFVKNATLELKTINTQIDLYMGQLMEINFDKVDRFWLKNQLKKFVNWINGKLKQLRQKIVNALKAMMAKAKKVLELIDPIVNISISLDTVVSWAMSVISFFMEPYLTVVEFIQDAVSYTPPLISEATTLATTVPTIPTQLQSKLEELKGEGCDVIREEIMNAAGGLQFEPITMGDIT